MKSKNLKNRFQELAGIKSITEASFDDKLKGALGMDDEEFEEKITSRDIGSPFPGTDPTGPGQGIDKASNLIDKLRQDYKNMSDGELDIFSKEMILHFLDNTTAQATAKIFFAKKGL